MRICSVSETFYTLFLSLKVQKFQVSGTHNNAIHYEDKNILEVHRVSKQTEI